MSCSDVAPESDDGSRDASPRRDDEASAADRLRDLGGYIRDQRNRAQLSLRNLAKIAGVSNPYLSQIERGLRKPSAEILQAIAKALRVSAETLYVKAGILEEREGGQDIESVIARDASLTEPQRRALVEMYRSFRRLHELEGEEHEAEAGARALDRAAGALEDAAGRVAPPAPAADRDDRATRDDRDDRDDR